MTESVRPQTTVGPSHECAATECVAMGLARARRAHKLPVLRVLYYLRASSVKKTQTRETASSSDRFSTSFEKWTEHTRHGGNSVEVSSTTSKTVRA